MSVKQHVIEETTLMFLEHGVKSIRMDDIAVRLGMSKRTLYELFGDRESLIFACLNHFLAKQEKEAQEVVGVGKNILEQFVLMLDFCDETPPIESTMITDLKRFYPAIFDKFAAQRKQRGLTELKEKLELGIHEGLILKSINLDFAAYMLAEMLNNVIQSPSSYASSNISRTEAFKYITMCFFRGISTAKGIELVDKLMREKYRKQVTEKKNSK